MPFFLLAHFSHHLLTALPIPLLPMIRADFALDYVQSGLVISVFTISYGIGQIPAGWLADRTEPRLLIFVGICGVALAGLFVGLSRTYAMMVIFLGLMGFLGGGYHPAAPPLISATVEPKNRGRALGIVAIGGPASHFFAPLMGAAIASIWGWRGSFIGLAVPTAIYGIIFYRLLGSRGVKGKRELKKTHKDAVQRPTPGGMARLITFIILSTVTLAVILSVIAFIPLFMVDHFGVGEKTAAVFISLFFSAGFWAAPLGGYLADRFGSVPLLLVLSFLSGPMICLVGFTPYGLPFVAVLVIIGVFFTMRIPVSEAYIIGNTPERHRSTILGVYFFSGQEVGGVLTPVMGVLIDRLGFHTSFTIAGAALVAVTLVCSFWLRGGRG